MFHDPHFDASRTAAWQEHLARGHVVLYRFPIRLAGEDEGPKARPCLALEIVSFAGQRFAVIAYGTSADSRANRGYDIDAKGADATAAGLDRCTRFVGARRITVPLSHKGFVRVNGTPSPVIGMLGGEALSRMNAVRARISAEEDMAADRRSERRRSRPRRARGKMFTVTRKTPKKLARPANRTGG